jgi:U3 small nucleolar RNA-associated protein 15
MKLRRCGGVGVDISHTDTIINRPQQISSMAKFQSLPLKQFPKIQERETSESKYWRSFLVAKEEKLVGSPSTIDFNPSSRGQFIVTSSAHVHLFEGNPDHLQRSFSRFNGDAYSGRYRKDGKLIVAGDYKGYVKVFDTHSKALLRQFKGHSSAARAIVWSSSGLQLFSGADDMSLRVWDLGTEDSLWNRKSAHTDYIRTLSANPVSPELFVSGSYDHTVKLWDSRSPNATQTLNHSFPVESTLITSSGTILFSAGGNEVKMWDIISGRLMNTFSNHQKNVTGLCFANSGSRLLSCGLDGHVKVYSMDTLQCVHGLKYNEPILSVGVSPDDSKLILGFVSGNLRIMNRSKSSIVDDEEGAGENNTAAAAAAEKQTQRRYKGAGAAVRKTYDDVVETERPHKLRPYESHLKKFNYQLALDTALKSRNPVVVITVLEELSRRSGLTVALSGRDDVTLEPILAFCARYVSHPRYTRLVVQVSHRILDLYASVLGRSDSIDELFHKLRQQVKAEVSFHRQVMRVMGSLDELISSSSLMSGPTTSSSSSSSDLSTPAIGIEETPV